MAVIPWKKSLYQSTSTKLFTWCNRKQSKKSTYSSSFKPNQHSLDTETATQWASDVLWTSNGRLFEVWTSYGRPLDVRCLLGRNYEFIDANNENVDLHLKQKNKNKNKASKAKTRSVGIYRFDDTGRVI